MYILSAAPGILLILGHKFAPLTSVCTSAGVDAEAKFIETTGVASTVALDITGVNVKFVTLPVMFEPVFKINVLSVTAATVLVPVGFAASLFVNVTEPPTGLPCLSLLTTTLEASLFLYVI